MAVDTAEQRFSMMNFGDGATIHLLPEPDGSVDLDDRQHLLDLYSGIALGGVVVGFVRFGQIATPGIRRTNGTNIGQVASVGIRTTRDGASGQVSSPGTRTGQIAQ